MGNNSAKHNLKWNIKISLFFCIILISPSLNQFGSVSYVLNQPLSVIKILDFWNDEYLFAYWRRTCAMEEKIFRQCFKRHISKLLSIFTKGSVLIFSFIFLHQPAGNIILPHHVACLWEDISKTSLIKPVSKTVLLLWGRWWKKFMFFLIFSLFLVVLAQALRILYLLWFYQYGVGSLSFIINFSLYAKIFLYDCSHLSSSISFLGGFWMVW